MASTFYRLPHHLPLVWTSATSVQVGVDPPRAHLSDVPPGATALLHALTAGIPASGVAMLARLHDLGPSWADSAVETLQPVFDDPPPPPPPRWEVWSASPAATTLVRLARVGGLEVTVPDHIDHTTVPTGDVVIVVSDYLHHPHWVNHLMMRGVPHLPVVFSDQTVTVGPLVVPGKTPCLVCCESHRRDTTDHWLEVSSQLWGKPSPLHRPDYVAIAWALVLLADHQLAPSNSASAAQRMVFRPGTGELTGEIVTPHPDCTCQELEGS